VVSAARPDDLLARAWAAAATVTDPEIPSLTIEELGVLREVRADGAGVEVEITPTYSGCPAMNVIALDIETALAKAGIGPARVRLVLSPAWTTDWLTTEGRRKLLDAGIAPPVPASGRRALFSAEEVACPRCGSQRTERVSEFGSTACKALYRCLACAEPFDYFKCL
jgi:ring-1,2-phenylacetyl-CoA epoxidase subunit PaaD